MVRQLWKRMEFSVLLAGIIIAVGLWSFQELAEVARDTNAHDFDTGILLALREPGRPDDPIGPVWLEGAVRDITSLGSMAVLLLVTLGAVIYLLMIRRRFEALLVLFTVAGGQMLSSLLKLGIDRPRPELVSHLADVQTLSFPSGHAMLSAVVYLTLGSLLAGHAASRAHEDLCARRRRPADPSGRRQPRLSRRPLAVRHPGRLVHRLCLGDGLLARRALAVSAAPSRRKCRG